VATILGIKYNHIPFIGDGDAAKAAQSNFIALLQGDRATVACHVPHNKELTQT